MDIIKDPKERLIKVPTTSVLISRSKTKEGKEYRSAIIKLFKINNPHKTQEFPFLTYEFTEIEKVRIRKMNVSYYLEGNDVVINDLEELYIIHEENKIILKGYQYEVEKRT